LLAQLRGPRPCTFQEAKTGGLLILWGLFKKMVLADRLAVMADTVFGDLPAHGGLAVALGTLAFAFQIYGDFSAYSDIARGSARLLGVELSRNFRAPYFAQSVREFWRRWHITLSQWFRDYLYVPLGGGRQGTARQVLNLLLVFCVSGLWHGAGLPFLAWGLLHGVYQALGLLWEKYGPSPRQHPIAAACRVLGTFGLTCLAWIFFRAPSVPEALYAFRALAAPGAAGLWSQGRLLGLTPADAAAALCAVLLTLWLDSRPGLTLALERRALPIRWAAYLGLALAVLVLGYYGGGYVPQNFLYFQF
jgi:D-alanyl-lipoteichoic acid acyltransferase DltB (MBOAT superfamily)